MKSTLFVAALFATATAVAQSSLTLPNNSAGTPMDTPPVTPAAKDIDVKPAQPPAAPGRDYLTREELQRLQEDADFDAADTNHDGKLDVQEFQRFWNGTHAPSPTR